MLPTLSNSVLNNIWHMLFINLLSSQHKGVPNSETVFLALDNNNVVSIGFNICSLEKVVLKTCVCIWSWEWQDCDHSHFSRKISQELFSSNSVSSSYTSPIFPNNVTQPVTKEILETDPMSNQKAFGFNQRFKNMECTFSFITSKEIETGKQK